MSRDKASVTVVDVKRVLDAVAADPDATSKDIAPRVGLSRQVVRLIRNGKHLGRALYPREAAVELEREGWAPDCMDAEEYVAWRTGALVQRRPLVVQPKIPDTTGAAWPCTDCPLSYAAEMRAVDRCNGEPGARVPTRYTPSRLAA
jgi:hypothetical protein